MPIFALITSPLGRMLGTAGAIALLAGSCSVQTARLHHAKADLAAAVAAQYVPDATGKPTRKSWEQLAQQASGDLGTCEGSLSNETAALDRQNAAVAAAKADGDHRVALAREALQAANSKASVAKAERILAVDPRGDECSRLREAEKTISENSQ